MKISTKGRYGLRAMIDLAAYGSENQPVFLSEIAKRQGISDKYLEHIFSALQKAGLVRAVRGKKGGYLLSRSANEITLNEILQVLEGPCVLVNCVSDSSLCDRGELCAARDIWAMLGEKIMEILKGITLADLTERQKEKSQYKALIYQI
jgi:Rrf2 family protein